jgi:glyoxylase-like metal-dependent hydrolase (beta-lactamase superfamily II)
MILRQLFDRDTSTYSYLLADPGSRQAALIDSVAENAGRDARLIREFGFELAYLLETHVHADHITGAGALRAKTGAQIVVSKTGAECADLHVRHGDTVELGALAIGVLETPGHTDDSVSYAVAGNVFTGDALFIRGCGRADFQNGDPKTLYRSITEVLFALGDDVRVWPGHDYKGMTCSTIAEEKLHNPRIAGKSEAEFVAIMNDLNLAKPKMIDVAVPANLHCGLPG